MEQLTSNIDILKTIFNYLKLEEQIIATQVCPEFQYIIVNCMWRYKYRHIKVFKLNGDTFIINTNYESERGNFEFVQQFFVELNQKEFSKFLKLNEENILELELYDYRSDDFMDEEKFCHKNKWSFPNLQKLILQFTKLDNSEMKMILKKCTNLNILHIKQCRNSNFELISLNEQDNCDYELLMLIVKTLKEFHLDYKETQFSNATSNLHDLLLNNNLINLNINMPLANLRYKETPRLRVNSCETLQIGNFNEYKILQKFCRLYLNCFENLLNLTLEGSLNKIFIETQFIEVLSKSCTLLKKINLKRCLMNVDNFDLLSSLREVSLDNCMSLTWRNLKQLLELPLLQHFHTNYSTYTREFVNVSIPLSLQSLTMVGNEFRFAQIFLSPDEQLINLKQLIYYDGSDDKICGISQKFPNLEVLHILAHHLDIKDLFQLKYLKCFELPKCRKNEGDNLSLMHLIKHPSLRKLSLTGGGNDFENSLTIDLSDVKLTRLYTLTLDFDLFNFMFEFLLDLLNRNSRLKLIVLSEDIASFQYYYELTQNRKFCRKSVALCGFQIDCCDFIAHPKAVKRKLELIEELSEFKNIHLII